MSKFKVGDTVIRLYNSHHNKIPYGHKYIVSSVNGTSLQVTGYTQWWEEEWFSLAASVETEAIKLLTEAGYTVTPPKPKLTGTVVVYQTPGGVYTITKTEWDKWSNQERKARTILALLNWTEGDGLTEKAQEASEQL